MAVNDKKDIQAIRMPEKNKSQSPSGDELSALSSGPGTSSGDQDDALAWLESLAAKRGAKSEELLTKPSEGLDAAPDWVSRVDESPAAPATPAAPARKLRSEALDALDDLAVPIKQEPTKEAAPKTEPAKEAPPKEPEPKKTEPKSAEKPAEPAQEKDELPPFRTNAELRKWAKERNAAAAAAEARRSELENRLKELESVVSPAPQRRRRSAR